jgi:hypothetical protein
MSSITAYLGKIISSFLLGGYGGKKIPVVWGLQLLWGRHGYRPAPITDIKYM